MLRAQPASARPARGSTPVRWYPGRSPPPRPGGTFADRDVHCLDADRLARLRDQALQRGNGQRGGHHFVAAGIVICPFDVMVAVVMTKTSLNALPYCKESSQRPQCVGAAGKDQTIGSLRPFSLAQAIASA